MYHVFHISFNSFTLIVTSPLVIGLFKKKKIKEKTATKKKNRSLIKSKYRHDYNAVTFRTSQYRITVVCFQIYTYSADSTVE